MEHFKVHAVPSCHAQFCITLTLRFHAWLRFLLACRCTQRATAVARAKLRPRRPVKRAQHDNHLLNSSFRRISGPVRRFLILFPTQLSKSMTAVPEPPNEAMKAMAAMKANPPRWSSYTTCIQRHQSRRKNQRAVQSARSPIASMRSSAALRSLDADWYGRFRFC